MGQEKDDYTGRHFRRPIRRPTRRRFLTVGAGALGAVGVTGRASASERQTSNATSTGGPDGPRRVRGMHIHPRWYWDADTVEESRRAMNDFLDLAAQANLNVLFAWLESPELAALVGESRYAESGAYDFWNRERWDAMGELISGAHERGMEVHFWYSFTRYKRSYGRVPEYDPDLSVLPPGDPDWASIEKSEYVAGHTDPADPGVDGLALCNNEFETHDWTLDALEAVFERYPRLAGLQIEEPGYLSLTRCVCYRCQNVYEQRYGEDGEHLLDHIYSSEDAYYEDGTAVPVKTRGTNRFTHALYDWWQENAGDRVLSYNGGWVARSDRIRGRNWAEWSRDGIVPYYFPQIYTSSMDSMAYRLRLVMDDVGATVVAPLLGVEWSSGENESEEVADQIERAHAMDGYHDTAVGGAGLFSGGALSVDLVVALRTGPYRTSEAPPWREENSLPDVGYLAPTALRRLDPYTWNAHWSGQRPGADRVSPDGDRSVKSISENGL